MYTALIDPEYQAIGLVSPNGSIEQMIPTIGDLQIHEDRIIKGSDELNMTINHPRLRAQTT